MKASKLREILIEKKKDIPLDELPEVLEYLEVFNEFFEMLKEDAFKRTILKEIYEDRKHRLRRNFK